MSNIYLNLIMERMNSLLGLVDSDKYSPTYGCFDRNFWLHKITDFPCADMHNMALTLALLYKGRFMGNKYYRNPRIKELAKATMLFWSKIGSKDGSYNEWYPNEHSFVSTAFTCYAISEAYLILKDEIKPKDGKKIEKALINTAEWLRKHNESVSNQQSVAVCAFYNLYLIFKKRKYLEECKHKLHILEENQSKEGWFFEYGGPDIGYLSVTIDCLAKYYSKSKDKQALRMIKSAIFFIKHFLHPDLTAGGEYGSRSTEYLYPDGFEIMKEKDIANFIIGYLSKNGLNFDERYLCYMGYTYIQAGLRFTKRDLSYTLPYQNIFVKYFREAGILINSTESYYCIVGLSKGGVIKLFDKKKSKLVYSDSGMVGRLTNGAVVSTQFLTKEHRINMRENGVSVRGKFYYIRYRKMNSVNLILFRLISIFIGWSSLLSIGFRNILRRLLITGSKASPISFSREFLFAKNLITIKNIINPPKNLSFKELSIGGNFSFLHIPSAKFFIDNSAKSHHLQKEELNKINSREEAVIVKKITF